MTLVKKAQKVVTEPADLKELRAAQAILLPALFGATLEQTASALGVGRSTVPRLQWQFRQRIKSGGVVHSRWGGRRRALMSYAEEQAFLAPWEELAKTGGVLVVSAIRAALSQKMGKPVAASVTYRLLARHGWRKVAPDTRHPKSDPALQEEWKKNFRKRWQPC